ncbi:MAG: Ig-like domain-containing protein [Rubrivivax sp.]
MSTLPHSSHPVGPWSARFGRLFLFLGAALVASGLSGCGGGGGSSEPPPVAAPTLEIRSGLDGAATGPFQVDFDFSGDAAGFSQNSFTLAGGTVATGSFKQVTARHYTVTIIPRDNSTGTVSLRVRSGAFTAVGGLLTNTVAYDFSKAYDTVKPQTEPTVNFSHVMQGASDTPPALVTITFDIDVQPFTVDALSVSSGTTVSAFTRVSPRVYTLVLTPPAQTAGLMTVTVPEGAVIGAVPGGVANTRPYAYGVLYPSWPG